jgi:hypothetical protein
MTVSTRLSLRDAISFASMSSEQALGIMNSASQALAGKQVTASVMDSYADFRTAVNELNAASELHVKDRLDLQKKRILTTPEGYQYLRSQSAQEATSAANDAYSRATAALDRMTKEIESAAQPKIDVARESAGRDELRTALAGANGGAAMARAMDAVDLSRESGAALVNGTFGRSLLLAHGVSGHEADDVIATARRQLASTAAEHGATPEERSAGQLANFANELRPALTPARAALSDLIDSDD